MMMAVMNPVIIAKWLALLLHILEVSSIISTMKSCVLPKPFMVLAVYTLRLHVTNLYFLPSHHPIVVLILSLGIKFAHIQNLYSDNATLKQGSA